MKEEEVGVEEEEKEEEEEVSNTCIAQVTLDPPQHMCIH